MKILKILPTLLVLTLSAPFALASDLQGNVSPAETLIVKDLGGVIKDFRTGNANADEAFLKLVELNHFYAVLIFNEQNKIDQNSDLLMKQEEQKYIDFLYTEWAAQKEAMIASLTEEEFQLVKANFAHLKKLTLSKIEKVSKINGHIRHFTYITGSLGIMGMAIALGLATNVGAPAFIAAGVLFVSIPGGTYKVMNYVNKRDLENSQREVESRHMEVQRFKMALP